MEVAGVSRMADDEWLWSEWLAQGFDQQLFMYSLTNFHGCGHQYPRVISSRVFATPKWPASGSLWHSRNTRVRHGPSGTYKRWSRNIKPSCMVKVSRSFLVVALEGFCRLSRISLANASVLDASVICCSNESSCNIQVAKRCNWSGFNKRLDCWA